MAMNYLQYPLKDCISLLTNPIFVERVKKGNLGNIVRCQKLLSNNLKFHLLLYPHKFSLL